MAVPCEPVLRGGAAGTGGHGMAVPSELTGGEARPELGGGMAWPCRASRPGGEARPELGGGMAWPCRASRPGGEARPELGGGMAWPCRACRLGGEARPAQPEGKAWIGGGKPGADAGLGRRLDLQGPQTLETWTGRAGEKFRGADR
jgi:hypothetical protein